MKKLERKLRTWWFYEGRGISYEEALIEYEHETKSFPKFKSRIKNCGSNKESSYN